jgi:hypothetical protein
VIVPQWAKEGCYHIVLEIVYLIGVAKSSMLELSSMVLPAPFSDTVILGLISGNTPAVNDTAMQLALYQSPFLKFLGMAR